AFVARTRAFWPGEADEFDAGLLLLGGTHPCVDIKLTGKITAEVKNRLAHDSPPLRRQAYGLCCAFTEWAAPPPPFALPRPGGGERLVALASSAARADFQSATGVGLNWKWMTFGVWPLPPSI